MNEDGIRVFIQEFSKLDFDEDSVIGELQDIQSELTRSRLAAPPKVIELHDLRELNHQALERAHHARERERIVSSRSRPRDSDGRLLHSPTNVSHNGHLNGRIRPRR